MIESLLKSELGGRERALKASQISQPPTPTDMIEVPSLFSLGLGSADLDPGWGNTKAYRSGENNICLSFKFLGIRVFF